MSEDLSRIPRRLRRFYRHGEPIPTNGEQENTPASRDNDHASEENEPWMNPPRAQTDTGARSRTRKEERNEAGARALDEKNNSTPASAVEKSSGGLFSRILHRSQQPSVTPMDHALGLHGKKAFEENPPRASEKALAQEPPLPKSAQAQKEIQSALQELRTLANGGAATKPNTIEKPAPALTSFHFTPAGEAPHPPQASEKNPPSEKESTLSPRERAELRKHEREGSAPETTPRTNVSPPPAPSGNASMSGNSPAHIRRRMGQLASDSTLPASAREEMGDSPPEKNNSSTDEEDFKSLFGEKKKEKKKKTSEDDEDFSLDEDGEELSLFDDK